MAWVLEATDEFQGWWKSLSDDEKAAVDAKIRLLEDFGTALPRPHADTLSKMSKHANMKELRIQHAGDAIACFSPSTRAASGLFCWEAGRATRNGTRARCPKRTNFTKNICKSFERKDCCRDTDRGKGHQKHVQG